MTELTTHPRVDDIVRSNREFAAAHGVAGLGLLPARQTIVLTCADPRVDPAAVLGLGLGDAVVIRNIAGRVTPATMRTIALLGAIARKEAGNPEGAWALVVVHHTDCGITRVLDQRDALAAEFGVAADRLDDDELSDPRRTLRADVSTLQANPFLPENLAIAGLLYDVHTGLVEIVVPPGDRAGLSEVSRSSAG
jgi:carbonic anhydrase